MEKFLSICLVALLFTLGAAPHQAQEPLPTLTERIDERSDLSTFSTFLQAASPDAIAALNEGSYTIFAPNNVAFSNLSSLLGLPLQELLQNPQVVTQLIQYHVVAGSLNSAQVADLSGQVVPTLLTGAFVGIRRSDDGTLTVNNVVEIVESDLQASNGVIHIINDVLLNRIIAATLENEAVEEVITPNPTSATSPSPVVATASEQSSTRAHVRFAQFAPDVGSVDVFLGQMRAIENLEYGEITSFQALPAATYTMRFVRTGEDETLIGPLSLNLPVGSFLTIAALGSQEADTLTATALLEDYSDVDGGRTRLLLFHALEDGLPLDLLEGDTSLITELAFGQGSTVEVSAATLDALLLRTAGDTPLVGQPAVPLEQGGYTFVALIGSAADPSFVVQSLSREEALALRRDEGPLLTQSPTPIGQEDFSDRTLLDVLLASDDFSILVEALETADEEVINRLNSRQDERITFLAPTNQAFMDLLATVNLSQGQLFAQPALLTQILLYHMVNQEVLAEDFQASVGTSVITRLPDNQAIFVSRSLGGELLLNGTAAFVQTDVQANNGVLHVIDDVLLPQSALDALGL